SNIFFALFLRFTGLDIFQTLCFIQTRPFDITPELYFICSKSRPDAKLQTYSHCALNRKMKSWDHGPGPASALTQKRYK
ncbi:hypothetical protein EHR49_24460, partial [Salmonella enterica]|nr:hypothetical protein [Salmonella enterica]